MPRRSARQRRRASPLRPGALSVEIVVRHKHGRVPAKLRGLADEKAGRVTRFLRDITRIDVEFEQERNPSVSDREVCEILVHVTGTLLKARACAASYEAALDVAVDKVEHQARKLHERRVQRSHPRRSPRGPTNAPDPGPDAAAGDSRQAVVTATLAGAVPGGVAAAGPASHTTSAASTGAEREIVRVRQDAMKPMSPREAAMQMDLLGHDFLLFTSSEHGRAAVIYRRRDGDLGLIEAG